MKADQEVASRPIGRDAPALCRASAQSNRTARRIQGWKTLGCKTKLRLGTVLKSLTHAVLVLTEGALSDIFTI